MKLVSLLIVVLLISCAQTDWQKQVDNCGMTSAAYNPPRSYIKRIDAGEADHCRLYTFETVGETNRFCRAVSDTFDAKTKGCWVHSASKPADTGYGAVTKNCPSIRYHELAHCLGWIHPAIVL